MWVTVNKFHRDLPTPLPSSLWYSMITTRNTKSFREQSGFVCGQRKPALCCLGAFGVNPDGGCDGWYDGTSCSGVTEAVGARLTSLTLRPSTACHCFLFMKLNAAYFFVFAGFCSADLPHAPVLMPSVSTSNPINPRAPKPCSQDQGAHTKWHAITLLHTYDLTHPKQIWLRSLLGMASQEPSDATWRQVRTKRLSWDQTHRSWSQET